MKIVAINSLPLGSPAQIMNEILALVRDYVPGSEVYSFFPAWNKRESKFDFCHVYGSYIGAKISAVNSILTGIHNLGFKIGTNELIKELKKIGPDVIHLHNLHIWPINIKALFNYIRKSNIKVVWTLHDCWAFTGHCTYFTYAKCEKWRDGCFNCIQKNKYPYSFIDQSKKMYELKKSLYSSGLDMTIVTPSMWLKQLVENSFLQKYPIVCINNGIDLNVFRPIASRFKEKNKLQGKKVILGVSLEWGQRKGLDVFNLLANHLPNDYVIFLVGVGKEEKKGLNEKILSIPRTYSRDELVEIYAGCDVFLNPTREDNFPTVNIEALACGLPVITFNNGGSPEIISTNCGIILDDENLDRILSSVRNICENREIYSTSNCVNRARLFDKTVQFKKYVDLFRGLVK